MTYGRALSLISSFLEEKQMVGIEVKWIIFVKGEFAINLRKFVEGFLEFSLVWHVMPYSENPQISLNFLKLWALKNSINFAHHNRSKFPHGIAIQLTKHNEKLTPINHKLSHRPFRKKIMISANRIYIH